MSSCFALADSSICQIQPIATVAPFRRSLQLPPSSSPSPSPSSSLPRPYINPSFLTTLAQDDAFSAFANTPVTSAKGMDVAIVNWMTSITSVISCVNVNATYMLNLPQVPPPTYLSTSMCTFIASRGSCPTTINDSPLPILNSNSIPPPCPDVCTSMKSTIDALTALLAKAESVGLRALGSRCSSQDTQRAVSGLRILSSACEASVTSEGSCVIARVDQDTCGLGPSALASDVEAFCAIPSNAASPCCRAIPSASPRPNTNTSPRNPSNPSTSQRQTSNLPTSTTITLKNPVPTTLTASGSSLTTLPLPSNTPSPNRTLVIAACIVSGLFLIACIIAILLYRRNIRKTACEEKGKPNFPLDKSVKPTWHKYSKADVDQVKDSKWRQSLFVGKERTSSLPRIERNESTRKGLFVNLGRNASPRTPLLKSPPPPKNALSKDMMFANALQGIPNVDTLPTPTDIKPKPPRLSSIGGSMSLTRNLSRLSNPSDAFTTQKLRPNKHLLGREFEESDDDDVVDFDVKGGWKLNKPERAEVTRDFIGERGDELSVDAGDTVIVRVVFDDGWGFGTNVRTKKVGVFPVFWIRPLEEDSMIAGGFDDCC